MNSTSWAICSSSYGLLLGAPENWRESKTAPPNINIFILLSSLTAPGRPSHAYSINKRHAQCTQVSVSIHTHPQIPWQKLFVLTRACKRNREKTNKHGQRWRMKKEMFREEKKWGGKEQTSKKKNICNSTCAHSQTRTFFSGLSICTSPGFEKRYFSYRSKSLALSLGCRFQQQANTMLMFAVSAADRPPLHWLISVNVMQTQGEEM